MNSYNTSGVVALSCVLKRTGWRVHWVPIRTTKTGRPGSIFGQVTLKTCKAGTTGLSSFVPGFSG